jgi:pentatricopeptide repeat protein
LQPDAVTLGGVLNACASVVALKEGRDAHEQIIQRGWESDVFLMSSLVDMYAKCGSMEDASRVFKKMPSLDVVPWNTMICGHVKCGQGQKALELFQEMQKKGEQPDLRTFVGLLNACVSVVALEEGRHAHSQIIEHGWDSDIIVGNSLIDMYSKCGSLEDACKVFKSMASYDVITWTAMISGHAKCGEGQKALELFHQMEQEGVQPTPITLVGVLNACASVLAIEEGRCAHEQIIENGWDLNVFMGNSRLTCMPNSGAWKMLAECSTSCHHMMWSLGMPYLEEMPCMGMGRKLLKILSGCVKVYNQMISLLFVFRQLVAMQVWW